MVKIIMLGPPGVGKGATSQLLANKLSLPHISTGDLFRDEIRKDSELSKEIKGIMEEGRLMSDEITFELLKKRVSEDDTSRGFILDGFPRNLKQAELLNEIIINKNDLFVINLVLSDDEIVKRLSNRRVCADCKKVYNLLTMPPKNSERCDFCSGSLVQRDDDKIEVIKKRLNLYKEETQPLINHYKELGNFSEVPTTHPPIEVVNDILSKIKVGVNE